MKPRAAATLTTCLIALCFNVGLTTASASMRTPYVEIVAQASASLALLGWLDRIDGHFSARGWTLDKDVPEQSIQVEFYVDGPIGQGKFAGKTEANSPRPDVNKVIGVPGDHGFIWPIPTEYLDGHAHKLYVYTIDPHGGTHPQLKGSPKSFTK